MTFWQRLNQKLFKARYVFLVKHGVVYRLYTTSGGEEYVRTWQGQVVFIGNSTIKEM